MIHPKISSLSKSPATKKAASNFPKSPGVYIFWSRSIPIYIGKAVNLRSRVSSYFSLKLEAKTLNMIREAEFLSFIKVTSELEALLLEASLIRGYQPKYNFISKDDKHPLYIKISKEKYPRVLTARKKESKSNIAFFGPFPSSEKVHAVLKMLRRVFPYSDHKLGKRPCIYSHIGLCNPCPNEIENLTLNEVNKEPLRKKYLNNIKMIKGTLSGRFNKVLSNLNKEMNNLSKKEKYEEAEIVKKQIENLNYITKPSLPEEEFIENPNLFEDIKSQESKSLREIISKHIKIERPIKRIECFDISHISGYLPTASMVTFIDGVPEKNLYRRFKVRQLKGSDDISSLKEIAKRRIKNLKLWGKPDLILVDGGKGQLGAFKDLSNNFSIPVVGIAKRYETLIFPNGEYRLKKEPALNLVQRIRNESHRFAQKYHNLLFKKSLLKS